MYLGLIKAEIQQGCFLGEGSSCPRKGEGNQEGHSPSGQLAARSICSRRGRKENRGGGELVLYLYPVLSAMWSFSQDCDLDQPTSLSGSLNFSLLLELKKPLG